VSLVEDHCDFAGLLEQCEAPLLGFQDLVMREIKARGAVECEIIRLLVLPEQAGLEKRVGLDFVDPVLDKRALGDDEDGVSDSLLEP
jgi:hypothetical protein